MNLLQIVKATGDAFIARAVESVKTDAGTTVDSRVNLRTSEDRIAVCMPYEAYTKQKKRRTEFAISACIYVCAGRNYSLFL